MSLTKLDIQKHSTYHANCVIEFAQKQQAANLLLTEIPSAACNFAIFLTQTTHQAYFDFKTVMSLVPEDNLFVRDHNWSAGMMPNAISCYPFTLMQNAESENGVDVAVLNDNPAIFDNGSVALFDQNGRETQAMRQLKTNLHQGLNEQALKVNFCRALVDNKLLKRIDLIVHYADGTKQQLANLYTIDEDALSNLTDSVALAFYKLGYFPILNALLMSIFQLNNLILLHNKRYKNDQVARIELKLPESLS